MTELRKVGDRIRDARLARGWSQARLAREAGVSENTVLNAETGKRKTQGEKVEAILDALGLASPSDDAVLDISGATADVRAFLRVAVPRIARMDEHSRAQLLSRLYAEILEAIDEQRADMDVEEQAAQIARDARAARDADDAQGAPESSTVRPSKRGRRGSA